MKNRKGNGNEDTKRVMSELDGYLPMCIRKEDQETIDAVMSVALPVIEATNPTTYLQAQTRLRSLVEMLLHVHHHEDDMDLDTILVDDYIEQYMANEKSDGEESTQRTVRSRLRSIARDANPQAWPRERRNLKRARVTEAYNEDDEAAFLLAGELACQRGKLDEAFLVVGSLGLGLIGTEIWSVESTHVTELGDGRLAACVDGKKGRRVVPVREAYTDLMVDALGQVGSGRFLHQKYRNASHDVARRMVVDGLGRFCISRGRSTWITAHLLAGTPLAALRAIAGPLAPDTLIALMEAASRRLTIEEAAHEGLRA